MIDAYLDESGIHDGAPICVVAGYFGGRGQWKKFGMDWCKSLDNAEVPLEKFHAKDLVRRQSFFADWSDNKHSDFLVEIASVICRYKIYPVTQSIVVADFNVLSLGERKFFTGGRVTDQGKLLSSGCPNNPISCRFNIVYGKFVVTPLREGRPTSSSDLIGHSLGMQVNFSNSSKNT